MEAEHYVILVSLELTTNDMVSKLTYFKTRKANITTWRQVYMFLNVYRVLVHHILPTNYSTPLEINMPAPM